MRRFTRARRSRRNITQTSALRDQFLRDLTREADALMKQLSEQFNQTLQTQVAQAFQGIIPGDVASPAPTAGANDTGTIGSISQLLATGARYLISRPRTSRDTAETARSYAADSAFRVSQAQAMAEAQALMSHGDKTR
jgi:hypothetical protein